MSLSTIATITTTPSMTATRLSWSTMPPCQWPQPELSVGTQTSRHLGLNKCWNLRDKSPAHIALSTILKEATVLLEEQFEHLETCGAELMMEIFMIGRKPTKCRPTVLISCTNKASRQKAMRLIEKREILTKHPGVVMAESSRLPRPLALEGDSSGSALTPGVYFTGDTDSGGLSILVSRKEGDDMAKATLGGFLLIEGAVYGLTVAHVFENTPPQDDLDDDDGPDSEFAFYGADEFSESSSEDEDLYETTSRASLSSISSRSRTTNEHTSDSGSLLSPAVSDMWSEAEPVGTPTSKGKGPNKSIKDTYGNPSSQILSPEEVPITRSAMHDAGNYQWLGDLFVSTGSGSTGGSSRQTGKGSLDWALVSTTLEESYFKSYEVPPSSSMEKARKKVKGASFNQLNRIVASIALEAADRAVLVCVGSHKTPLRGRLSSNSSFTMRSGSEGFQELWSVTLEDGYQFEEGYCGSWVIDSVTGKWYGHVVSGFSGTRSGYIVPASQILHDIGDVIGHPVHFISQDFRAVDKIKTPEVVNTNHANISEKNARQPGAQIQTSELTTKWPKKSKRGDINYNDQPSLSNFNMQGVATPQNTTGQIPKNPSKRAPKPTIDDDVASASKLPFFSRRSTKDGDNQQAEARNENQVKRMSQSHKPVTVDVDITKSTNSEISKSSQPISKATPQNTPKELTEASDTSATEFAKRLRQPFLVQELSFQDKVPKVSTSRPRPAQCEEIDEASGKAVQGSKVTASIKSQEPSRKSTKGHSAVEKTEKAAADKTKHTKVKPSSSKSNTKKTQSTSSESKPPPGPIRPRPLPSHTRTTPPQPRPMVTVNNHSSRRPASYYGNAYTDTSQPRPPLSNSAFSHQSPVVAGDGSYPPYFPQYTGPQAQVPDYFAQSSRSLAERFEPVNRPMSAYGMRDMPMSYMNEYAPEPGPGGRRGSIREPMRTAETDRAYMPPPPPPASRLVSQERQMRPRRAVSYHDGNDFHVETGSSNRRTQRYYEPSLRERAQVYQEDVAGTTVPLTAEALRRERRHAAASSSSQSTDSRHSSDWSRRSTATTRATMSDIGDDDEDFVIKISGGANIVVGGTPVKVTDGGEIQIRRRGSFIDRGQSSVSARSRSRRRESPLGRRERSRSRARATIVHERERSGDRIRESSVGKRERSRSRPRPTVVHDSENLQRQRRRSRDYFDRESFF